MGRSPLRIKEVRRVVRELMSAPIDRSGPEARHVTAQDTLEFAAMLLGMKPVFLLGRGFDDPSWITTVKRVASRLGLEIVDGAYWNRDYSKLKLPAWFCNRHPVREEATYICLRPETAAQVRAICARGWVSPAEEAALLGYPRCCVETDHEGKLLGENVLFGAAMKAAQGDEEEARRMILDDVEFTIEDEEAVRFKAATELRPCRFTSVFMCAPCSASDRSPARKLSAHYMKLAKDLDPALFRTLEESSALMRKVEGRSPFEKRETADPRIKEK